MSLLLGLSQVDLLHFFADHFVVFVAFQHESGPLGGNGSEQILALFLEQNFFGGGHMPVISGRCRFARLSRLQSSGGRFQPRRIDRFYSECTGDESSALLGLGVSWQMRIAASNSARAEASAKHAGAECGGGGRHLGLAPLLDTGSLCGQAQESTRPQRWILVFPIQGQEEGRPSAPRHLLPTGLPSFD